MAVVDKFYGEGIGFEAAIKILHVFRHILANSCNCALFFDCALEGNLAIASRLS